MTVSILAIISNLILFILASVTLCCTKRNPKVEVIIHSINVLTELVRQIKSHFIQATPASQQTYALHGSGHPIYFQSQPVQLSKQQQPGIFQVAYVGQQHQPALLQQIPAAAVSAPLDPKQQPSGKSEKKRRQRKLQLQPYIRLEHIFTQCNIICMFINKTIFV